jgi:ech hydrogenase subunit D
MTAPDQTLEIIPLEALLDRTRALREEGRRLVQICATRLPDQVELTYSFDLECRMASLRVMLPAAEARIPSISSIFWCAFLYENEIHDLFNVEVTGMAVDFHGNFYKTAVKFPFGRIKPPAAPTATPGT